MNDLTTFNHTLPSLVDRAAEALAHARTAAEILEAREMASLAYDAAQRIRARAIRRAGELLRQMEPGQGARDGKREASAHTPSRNEVARVAGFSDYQIKQALRVAAVPAADFERQVEGDSLPTITELARQGKRAKPGRPPASSAARPIVEIKGRDPEETDRVNPFVGASEDALRILEDLDLEAVPLLPPEGRAKALNLVGQIDVITDKIIVKMSQGRYQRPAGGPGRTRPM